MSISLDDYIKKLPKDSQARIAARTDELIGEEMSLRELRQARELSQESLSELLNMRQGDVSKLERKADAYLSTVRKFVEAIGGRLDLIATFPDFGPIKITQLGESKPSLTTKRRRNLSRNKVRVAPPKRKAKSRAS
jgi:transcriptional regulator with XRE-family HTH domain